MTIATGQQILAADVLAIAATRELFLPFLFGVGATEGAAYGFHHAWKLDATDEYITLTFKVPHDFTAITEAKVILIGGGTDRTIDWTVTTNFGAVGEDWDLHTDSATADATAITAYTIKSIDVSGALTALAAGDYVGLKFNLDAISTASVYVFGLLFKYS